MSGRLSEQDLGRLNYLTPVNHADIRKMLIRYIGVNKQIFVSVFPEELTMQWAADAILDHKLAPLRLPIIYNKISKVSQQCANDILCIVGIWNVPAFLMQNYQMMRICMALHGKEVVPVNGIDQLDINFLKWLDPNIAVIHGAAQGGYYNHAHEILKQKPLGIIIKKIYEIAYKKFSDGHMKESLCVDFAFPDAKILIEFFERYDNECEYDDIHQMPFPPLPFTQQVTAVSSSSSSSSSLSSINVVQVIPTTTNPNVSSNNQELNDALQGIVQLYNEIDQMDTTGLDKTSQENIITYKLLLKTELQKTHDSMKKTTEQFKQLINDAKVSNAIRQKIEEEEKVKKLYDTLKKATKPDEPMTQEEMLQIMMKMMQ